MAGPPLVTSEVDGGLALLTLCNPPRMNALSPELLEALFVQLRKAHSNSDVRAIVLTGAGGKFCAGFDFTLFGTPAMDELLDGGRRDVLAQFAALVENGPKPTVAAIEGLALGGGCELAMACSARVCAADAQVGLPEVRLGLLPGLGGTQRLPRLVGVEQALNLMLSGQPIPAADALELGLVDAVVPAEEVLPAAKRLALDTAAGKAARRRTLQLTAHMQQQGEQFAASVRALQEAKAGVDRLRLAGQQHYPLLIDAVAAGLAEGPAAGLQQEGEGFRIAARSRLHRMTLSLFNLDRALRKARGPTWVLAQFRALLALLLLVVYVKLLIPYTLAARLLRDFKRGFQRGYQGKQQAKQEAAAVAAAGASTQEATGRKGK